MKWPWVRRSSYDMAVADAYCERQSAAARAEACAGYGAEVAKLMRERDEAIAKVLALETVAREQAADAEMTYGRQVGETEAEFAERRQADLEGIRGLLGTKALLWVLKDDEERSYGLWLSSKTPEEAERLRLRAMASQDMRKLIVTALNKRVLDEHRKAAQAARAHSDLDRYLELQKTGQSA